MGLIKWLGAVLGGQKPASDPAPPADDDTPQGSPQAHVDPGDRLLGPLMASTHDGPRPFRALMNDATLARELQGLCDRDPAAAIRVLRRYEAADPGEPSLLGLLGKLYQTRGDLDSARVIFERLASQQDVAAEAFDYLGRIAERQGDESLARVYYEQALAEDWTREGCFEACVRLTTGTAEPKSAPPFSVALHEPPEGFELVHPLGRGGFGTVYLARDKALDRPVAIKFLHRRLRKRADRVEQLFDEARTVAALQHPGVVGLYELDRERYAVVMEYMMGGTLADRLAAGRAIDTAAALLCARQLCTTLSIVHDAGLVHRDIKPENVLFRRQAEAVLGDFGIAKLEDARDERLQATRSHAAPEVLAGRPVDRRADIYGVGLLLCEMLTGASPPSDANRRLRWVDDAVGKMDCDAPSARAWLSRLTAIDPDERPKSASAVAAACSAWRLVLAKAPGAEQALALVLSSR